MLGSKVSVSSLKELVESIAYIIDRGSNISNKQLIEICKDCDSIDWASDTHIYHEIAEAALNLLVSRKYGRELLAYADPVEAVSKVLRPLQERLPTQTWTSGDQIIFQQFSTPITIAFLAAYLLNIRAGETVLDPSCGTGSLAVLAKAAGADVITNEIDPGRRQLAETVGLDPNRYDAEFIDDLLPESIVPDVVLMNPPFSSSSGRIEKNDNKFGFRHVASALRRLSAGGRLAVILGE